MVYNSHYSQTRRCSEIEKMDFSNLFFKKISLAQFLMKSKKAKSNTLQNCVVL